MKRLLLIFPLALLSSAAFAANPDNGEELHMESCSGCHDTSVYTRPNRRIQSLPRLGRQVRFCKDNLGITWFDDEVDDVTHYLNRDFYHFK